MSDPSILSVEDEAVNLVVEVDGVQIDDWTDEIRVCTRLAQGEGREGLRMQGRVKLSELRACSFLIRSCRGQIKLPLLGLPTNLLKTT